MRTTTLTLLLGCCMTAVPSLAAAGNEPVQGQSIAVAPVIGFQPAPSSAVPCVPPIAVDGMGAVVDANKLDDQRGGYSTVDNEVGIDGTLSNNVAKGTVSGSNMISDGAFDSAAGINTVIQNTGNNVLIQNGMVVNVQFVAPVP